MLTKAVVSIVVAIILASCALCSPLAYVVLDNTEIAVPTPLAWSRLQFVNVRVFDRPFIGFYVPSGMWRP